MDISYKRTPNENYMIIEGEPIEIGYVEKMLKENTVEVLLGFYTMEMNGYLQFWYEISGKKSLRDFFEQEGVSRENLYLVFRGISQAFLRLSEFLIQEDGVYMDPDTVFLEKDSQKAKVYLCYCPLHHCDYLEQLRSIMKYIIAAADHRQAEITELCYKMFAITEQSVFSLADLLACLEEVKSKPKELESADILEAAREVGEDFFDEMEEEETATGLFEKIKENFRKWRKKFFYKKEELFPEDDVMSDLEFEEVECATETVLLAENMNFCCGKLMYEGGGNGDKDYIISHSPFRIGSKEGGNDAVLHSSVVSRYHAKIFKRDGIYYLEDLNSKNGTYLNGQMISYHEAMPLKSRDTISFADVVYRVV